ncbi:MAG: N-acetylmannosamine-6-phosphate 2-epimerase [Erysipelotrichaceae bacterium]|nr:N-acetylmannosamine-6-phosphate 2-epimerase [Erysipelotrichaceae bacterium]
MLDLESLRGGLVVSCQAFPYEPLYGGDTMVKLAMAAEQGGACAIRANGPDIIRAIKEKVSVPVFGIYKLLPEHYDKMHDVIITPTIDSAKAIIEAGADIIAVDCTLREGRTKQDILDLIHSYQKITDIPIMGEVSNLEEGLIVEEAGCQIVSTTIAGYTDYSRHIDEPDYELVKELAQNTKLYVNAEGRFSTPQQVKKALECGAWTVTVGSAITRPKVITEHFIEVIKGNDNEK